MSSSSTASQLRRPHLQEGGTAQQGWSRGARGVCAEPGQGMGVGCGAEGGSILQLRYEDTSNTEKCKYEYEVV